MTATEICPDDPANCDAELEQFFEELLANGNQNLEIPDEEVPLLQECTEVLEYEEEAYINQCEEELYNFKCNPDITLGTCFETMILETIGEGGEELVDFLNKVASYCTWNPDEKVSVNYDRFTSLKALNDQGDIESEGEGSQIEGEGSGTEGEGSEVNGEDEIEGDDDGDDESE